MTKITVHDTYLHKNITFYVNQNFNSKHEVENTLRLQDYLYFPIVSIKNANKIEKLFIPVLYKKTKCVEDVLFYHVKYLIIK